MLDLRDPSHRQQNPSTSSPWGLVRLGHPSLADRAQPHSSVRSGEGAVRRGVSELALRRFLGHADVRSTRRYAQLGDEALVHVLRPAKPRLHRVVLICPWSCPEPFSPSLIH
jgi:hypothetical protein